MTTILATVESFANADSPDQGSVAEYLPVLHGSYGLIDEFQAASRLRNGGSSAGE